MSNMTYVSDVALARISAYFKALGDVNRLRILRALMERERTVGELVELLGGSQANVSKHVAVLVDAGILGREQRGTFSHLHITDPQIRNLCDAVCGSVGRSLQRELELSAELLGRGRRAAPRSSPDSPRRKARARS